MQFFAITKQEKVFLIYLSSHKQPLNQFEPSFSTGNFFNATHKTQMLSRKNIIFCIVGENKNNNQSIAKL